MANDWREHPKLKGRFHPDRPDDLQIMVHDGGPRFTDRRPEILWTQVLGADGDVFIGRVLDQPNQLKNVQAGAEIRFIAPESGSHPLLVTGKYLGERALWRLLAPCRKCGMSELFDAPSDLIRAIFPQIPADIAKGFTFTTRCGCCGEGVVVRWKRGAGLP
jgi:hypothetical protein